MLFTLLLNLFLPNFDLCRDFIWQLWVWQVELKGVSIWLLWFPYSPANFLCSQFCQNLNASAELTPFCWRASPTNRVLLLGQPWDPSFILNQALSRHSPPKTPAHHRRERKRKRGDGEEEEVVGSWSRMICRWNRKCHLWRVRWIKNRAAFIDVSGSLKFSERRWAGKRENHCQEQSSIPKIMKRNGCRGRSTQDDECTERRLSICLSVNLFACLLLVCLCAHVLVSLCMCVILFRLNANSRSQIKKIVLEQYSIIDFSCVLPVGWHPYYTDKWSKSQDCVSTIKPLRGTDLPPKHRNSGGMWRDMPWKCFPGCSESPEGV